MSSFFFGEQLKHHPDGCGTSCGGKKMHWRLVNDGLLVSGCRCSGLLFSILANLIVFCLMRGHQGLCWFLSPSNSTHSNSMGLFFLTRATVCHSPTGGAIRWYHITGMILVLRGEPSMASEEWHELHRPQLALPGAQATQAPQAPQAMPQPVQGVPAQPPTMKLGV